MIPNASARGALDSSRRSSEANRQEALPSASSGTSEVEGEATTPTIYPSEFITEKSLFDSAAPQEDAARGFADLGSARPNELWAGDSARVSAPQAKVSSIPLDKGATAILDRAMFDRLARRDNVPGAMGVREVKFLMTDVDSAAPQLYFLNTNNIVYHYDFARGVLGQPVSLKEFERRTYFSDNRKNLAGSVVAHDAYESGEQQGLYSLEFWPTDPVKAEMVALAFNAVKEAMPFAAAKLAYHPAGDTQEALYLQEKATYQQRGVRTVSTEAIYQSVKFQPLNPGVGFGVLRVVDPAQPDGRVPSIRDVVIFKSIPNDLSHVGGILTEDPQTTLSHINLKAKPNKTPNAYVKDVTSDPKVQALLGKPVRYEVGPDGIQLREATPAEVSTWLETVRPKNVTRLQYTPDYVTRALSNLSNADWKKYGAKAANLGELTRLLPGNVPPKPGYGVPMAYYDEFMKANGLYAEAQRMMAEPRFKEDADYRDAQLRAFRRKIRDAEVPAAISRVLDTVQKRFPQGTNMRCRSSTNIEDLPGFNGAGLHDSHTHRADEGPLEETVKQVWSSLWTFRAFDEREFHRIDHLSAKMGVAIHPNFDDERSNGVAVTKNIYDPNWNGFYVNVQAGESLVTNPDEQATPDELLISAIGPKGEYETQFIRRSSLAVDGKPLLDSKQISELTEAMELIQSHFARVYGEEGNPDFAMDIEFKFDVNGKLVVKQARPWVD